MMVKTVLFAFLWGALAVNGNSAGPSLRLVGGHTRCQGQVQMQRSGRDWVDVDSYSAPLWFGNRVCADLDCGPALRMEMSEVSGRVAVLLYSGCEDSSLISCFRSTIYHSQDSLKLSCSDSVRLVSGQSSCSGSVRVRDQSLSQSWTSVCEGAVDLRGAEVLCSELGCGAPLLQGELPPLGQTFHCEGHESALMDCPRNHTGTDPETCPGSTLNLTCTEPLRLVGGASRCEGTVEAGLGAEWRRLINVYDPKVSYGFWDQGFARAGPGDLWDLKAAAAVCRDLRCGSAVYTEYRGGFSNRDVWRVRPGCVKKSSVRDCLYRDLTSLRSDRGFHVVCSDLLSVPEVSVSEGSPRVEGGVWVQTGANFRVKCSVKPRYRGGSFRLLSPTANVTLPAVNHTAHFLFTDAGHAHSGKYTCVYFLERYKHNFSSRGTLHIYPEEPPSPKLTPVLILVPVCILVIAIATALIYYKRRTGTGEFPHVQMFSDQGSDGENTLKMY